MKTFLKICAWFVGSTVVMSIALAVAMQIYEREIIDLVLQYFAEQQEVTLQKATIELSLRRAFPYCGIGVSEVRISRRAVKPSQASFDIAAEQMYVSINPLTFLFEKKIDVNRIWLLGGSAKIILPKKMEAEPAQSFLMDINKIEIEQFVVQIDGHIVDIEYVNVGLKQDNSAMLLSADGDFTLRSGKIADLHPILQTPANVHIQMAMEAQHIYFTKSEIVLANTRIGFAGEISPTTVALQIECKKGILENAAPFFIPQESKIIDLRGRIGARIYLSGEQGINGRLRIEGTSTLQKASAIYNERAIEMREASLHFISDDMNNLQLYICNVSNANLRANNFNAVMNAKITGLSTPYIQLQAEVDGKLQMLSDMFEQGEVRGNIAAELYGTDFEVNNLKGKLQVDNALTMVEQKPYRFDGDMNITTQSISFPSLKIKCNYGEGVFKGKVSNYMALQRGNADEIIRIAGILDASHINADSIMVVKAKVQDGGKNLPQIKAKVEVSTDELLLFNYLHTRSSFLLQYSSDKLLIKNVICNAFDGQVFGNVAISAMKVNNGLSGNIHFKDIHIDKMPYFDNYFKQGSLLGTMSGNIDLTGHIPSAGFDMNNIKGNFNFTIEDGQMINFEPIQSLAEYVQKDVLKHVRFLTLKNTLTIEHGAIHIPQMEVRSSALNTYIEGRHYFNSDFDYNIILYFSELLRGKAQRLENPIKDGKTKVFLHAVKKDGKLTIDHTTDIGKSIKATLRKEQESFAKAKDHTPDKRQASPIAIEHEDVSSPKQTQEDKKADVKKEKAAVEIEWEDK
jgi:hypothetical protein